MFYALLFVAFLMLAFLAYSAFSWMGLLYFLLVPVPLMIYTIYFRKKRQAEPEIQSKSMNIWTSPIPYFSLIFVLVIVFNVVINKA